MGFFDSLTSLIPFSTPVDAEAATSSDNAEPRGGVKGGASNKTPAGAAGQGESGEEEEVNKQDAVKGKTGASGGDSDDAEGDDGGDEPAEEEEEEEEEPEDRKEALEEGEFAFGRPVDCLQAGKGLQLLTAGGGRMRQFEAMQAAQDAL
jgi:hypothetical protein